MMRAPRSRFSSSASVRKGVLTVPILIMVLLASAMGQYSEEAMSDRLKALKTELEEQKRLRDRVIAKRWEDKKTYNDAREKFNSEYDELKDKLEQKNLEAEKEHEIIESILKKNEDLKSKLESEKVQFLGLSYIQKNAVSELSRELGKRFPAMVPERQKKINSALKSAETKKDNPKEILNDLMDLFKTELGLTREIVLEKRGLILSDYTPGAGLLLRIGMVASAYKDEKSGRTGIMLRTSNTSGKLFEWREDLTAAAKEALNLNMGKLENTAASKHEPGAIIMPMDILRTRIMGGEYTRGDKKGFIGSSRAYFKAGGIWMWPLAAIAFAALLLLIEKYFSWFRKNSGNKSLFEKALESARGGNIREALKICGAKKNSRVFKAMAAVFNHNGKSREIAEKELQEVMLEEGPALEKRLATISVLGAAAPLLGLLGTVAGMIQLFESITLYGTSDPKLMASGISIALITTQTGLSIAVPIMILHNFMANRIDNLQNAMETYALKALNLLWPEG